MLKSNITYQVNMQIVKLDGKPTSIITIEEYQEPKLANDRVKEIKAGLIKASLDYQVIVSISTLINSK